MQDDEFNHFAYAQNPEKKLVYFGGVMGFNTLSNNIEKSNRTPPNSKIIEVKLNLHSQEKSLNLYEPIILKNYENSLSFIFASLNFISPKKNKFRTKLEEWDKEWLELGESNQINYRGSTGYGRKFWEASFKQWGKKMQDDLTDGVNWLIEQGIADPKRIAIYGGSYGGYATLSGLTFTPDLYACGVDYVGVSNLFTLIFLILLY